MSYIKPCSNLHFIFPQSIVLSVDQVLHPLAHYEYRFLKHSSHFRVEPSVFSATRYDNHQRREWEFHLCSPSWIYIKAGSDPKSNGQRNPLSSIPGRFFADGIGLTCDEFPAATFIQGGDGAETICALQSWQVYLGSAANNKNVGKWPLPARSENRQELRLASFSSRSTSCKPLAPPPSPLLLFWHQYSFPSKRLF